MALPPSVLERVKTAFTESDRRECLSYSKQDRRGLSRRLFCISSGRDSGCVAERKLMNAADLPIACNLNDADFQQRRAGVLQTVRDGVLETVELDDGFAYRFPSEGNWIAELAQLITFERECCPFLQFNLRLEPADGPIWLELSGPEGTKEFLKSAFGE
jgi:hypothetical protein